MISAIGEEKMILNGIQWGSVAEWFGAIGTIGAVWLAINYRRTKVKFDVDAVFKVVFIPMAGELPVNISSPQLEIDIFNINDPDLMIKDIAIIKPQGCQLSKMIQLLLKDLRPDELIL